MGNPPDHGPILRCSSGNSMAKNGHASTLSRLGRFEVPLLQEDTARHMNLAANSACIRELREILAKTIAKGDQWTDDSEEEEEFDPEGLFSKEEFDEEVLFSDEFISELRGILAQTIANGNQSDDDFEEEEECDPEGLFS